MHPGEHALSDLFTSLRRAIERPAQTTVRYQSDESYPGRTAITIIGPTRELVQREIDHFMRYVEDSGYGGSAQFFNPGLRVTGGYESEGEVIIHAP